MIRAARLQRGDDQGWLLAIAEQLCPEQLPELPWTQQEDERDSLLSSDDGSYIILKNESEDVDVETQSEAKHTTEKLTEQTEQPVASSLNNNSERDAASSPPTETTNPQNHLTEPKEAIKSPVSHHEENVVSSNDEPDSPVEPTHSTEKSGSSEFIGGLPPLSKPYRQAPRAYPESHYSAPNKGETVSQNELPDRALRAKNYLEAEYNLSNQQSWYDRKASSNRKWATRLGF